MQKSTLIMLAALLLVACLLSSGCLSLPGLPGFSDSSKAMKTPAKTPTPTPTKTPTKIPTLKPTNSPAPCKNCVKGNTGSLPVGI